MKNTITSWRVAFKRWSNRIVVIMGLLPLGWLTMPEDWREAVVAWNDGVLALVGTGLAMAAFIASNLRQKELEAQMKEAYAKPSEPTES